MVDSWGFLLLIVFALVWWIVFSMLDMFVLQLLQLLREVISVVARGCDPKAKMERHKHKPVRLLVSQVPREPTPLDCFYGCLMYVAVMHLLRRESLPD